jgi:hypothetical protein
MIFDMISIPKFSGRRDILDLESVFLSSGYCEQINFDSLGMHIVECTPDIDADGLPRCEHK